MQHNHNPDATWETTLVIPETSKPIDVQTLDALLRIEGLLQKARQPAEPDVLPELVEEEFPTKEAFNAAKSAQVTRRGKRKP